MEKLKHILLIDDDETNNFLVSHLINQSQITENIHIALNGEEGLNKLKELCTQNIKVDLILLDINMPVMNGFEFLEEYERLTKEHHSRSAIMMVSSSVHPADLERIKSFESVNDFIEKPLTEQLLDKIIQRIN